MKRSRDHDYGSTLLQFLANKFPCVHDPTYSMVISELNILCLLKREENMRFKIVVEGLIIR